MYYTIVSDLTPNECLKRIQRNTEKGKIHFPSFDFDKKFKGNFNENKFKLRLIKLYRNPATAIVIGKVIRNDRTNKTSILLTISLDMNFYFILFFGLVLFFIFSAEFSFSLTDIDAFFIIVFIVFTFFSILMYFVEKSRIVKYLSQITESTEIKEGKY